MLAHPHDAESILDVFTVNFPNANLKGADVLCMEKMEKGGIEKRGVVACASGREGARACGYASPFPSAPPPFAPGLQNVHHK